MAESNTWSDCLTAAFIFLSLGSLGFGAQGVSTAQITGTVKDQSGAVLPEWQRKFDANKPSFGPRAVPPALGNDIIGNCNPSDVPGLFGFVEPFEFIVARDKVVQFYSWERAIREV